MCYDIIFNYTITYSFSPRRPLAYRMNNSYPTFLLILFTLWFTLRPCLCYFIQNPDWLQNYSFIFLGISLVLLSHQLIVSWLLPNLSLLALWKYIISVLFFQPWNWSAKRFRPNLPCPFLGAKAKNDFLKNTLFFESNLYTPVVLTNFICNLSQILNVSLGM